MKHSTKSILIGACAAGMLLPLTASATNGYFSHGTGIKSKAMGGVGIAKSGDALAAGTNPANMFAQGNRVDFGLDRFSPDRSTSVTGNANPANNIQYDPNMDSDFYIPEFGYNQMLNDKMAFGVSVYGNGGMNTSYNRNVTLFGTTNAGVNLEQLFIAPTFSMKVDDKNTFGVSLNLIYQTFSATGLENFDSAANTSAVGSVTNNGTDTSTGFNVRLGWTMEASDTISLGAFYQSKADMSNFDKYKGLFAEQGDFDIPSTYGIGINVAASKALNIGFDITKINYSEVAAISNPLGPSSSAGVIDNTLGTANGAGFGWQDMTVYKLGAAYAINSKMTLLGGYNYGKQPIPADQTFFNMLAPGVTEETYTLGLTYELASKAELTFMFMYAPEKKVDGSGSIPATFGGGESNISMSQTSFGMAYGWKF